MREGPRKVPFYLRRIVYAYLGWVVFFTAVVFLAVMCAEVNQMCLRFDNQDVVDKFIKHTFPDSPNKALCEPQSGPRYSDHVNCVYRADSRHLYSMWCPVNKACTKEILCKDIKAINPGWH